MDLLKGIRVLDLTTMVSGPVAATILADQGAEVIKVEPIHGEQMRHVRSSHFGVNPMFFSCNRGKKSISLDLKSDQGKDVLWKLIETADILVQNFRPGAIEKMGFSIEKVREKNKRLIFVSMSGFGDEGPYAQKRVYDPVIQALSGAAEIQGDHKTGEPHLIKLIVADKVTSLTTSQAITAALYSREKTGEGQHVKISMLDCVLSFFWPEGMSNLTYDDYEVDNTKSMSAVEPLFMTKDGKHITAVSVADSEWVGICRAFGRADLIEDARFKNAVERFNNAEVRKQIVTDEIAKWNSDEILERLDAEDVPCAPVLKLNELCDHPQILTNGSIHRFNVPGYGNIKQARPPAQFENAPFDGIAMAPELGEHTEALLSELGFSDDKIKELSNEKAVRLVG